MICHCGEPAEVCCVDCEEPICDDHAYVAERYWQYTCGACMDDGVAS